MTTASIAILKSYAFRISAREKRTRTEARNLLAEGIKLLNDADEALEDIANVEAAIQVLEDIGPGKVKPADQTGAQFGGPVISRPLYSD